MNKDVVKLLIAATIGIGIIAYDFFVDTKPEEKRKARRKSKPEYLRKRRYETEAEMKAFQDGIDYRDSNWN